MKKISKYKLTWSLLAILCIIIIVFIVLALNKSNKSDNSLLYEEIYYGATDETWGYVIYYNGTIQKYDKSMSAKITNIELKQLKQLSIEVESDYETEDLIFNLAGGSISQIYNSRKSQWVILSQVFSREQKHNVSKAGIELMELTDRLYDTYLNNNSK